MVPNVQKNYENYYIEFIFLIAQLDKDLLTIQHHFYRFWHHNLPDIDKTKTMYFFQIFLFYIFHENWSLTCKDVLH